MATNKVSEGNVWNIPAPAGGVQSGVPVALSTMVAVPLETAASGEQVAVAVQEAWRLPKAAGATEAMALGESVNFLSGNITNSAASGSIADVARVMEAAATGAAEVKVLLTP